MYDDFKIANYSNSLVSPELYARLMSRLFKGDVVDGLTVVPGTGLKVTLQPGNALLHYGSTAVESSRVVSLVADFSLDIAQPDASNPRIDAVVLFVDGSVTLPVVDENNPPTSANLDGPGVAKAVMVEGSPSANPVAPTETAIQSAIGAGNSFTVVSHVTVDPGVSVIAEGKISDSRKMAGLTSPNIDFATIGVASGTFDSTQSTRKVTGLGFKPRMVEFMFFPAAATTAAYTGSGFMLADGSQAATATFAGNNGTSRRVSDTNRCLLATNATATFVAAQFVSMDDDGFTVNFVSTAGSNDVWSWRAIQ